MDALQQLNLAAPITDTYTRIESMIIMHIAEQIAGNPQGLINNSSEWRIQMLARMGKLSKDTAKIIASQCKGVGYEIEAAINSSVQSVLRSNGLTMTDKLSENIRSALTNYDRQAISGKYNQVNTVMQYKSKQAYLNAVNGTVSRFDRIMEKELANKQEHLDVLNTNAMAVTLGERSRTQAIRETIEEMSDKGIPAFIDASGREWSAEAYVNMDIRNTVKNAANAAQFASIEELGQDIVLVSSHTGARPLCAPYQGKFYSLSGKSGTIRDARGREYTYEPWSSTSYGEPAGLLGINCGHTIRGVSDGAFVNREKQYNEKENSEEYEKVTKQRALERNIRKQKTTRNALKAAGDDEGVREYDRKIRESNAKLDAYCKENGLTNRRDRTEVYGYSDSSRKQKPKEFVEAVEPKKPAFVPAGTVEEAQTKAETHFKEYFGDKTFKGKADFKGISLDNANDICQRLDELYVEYDIPPLAGIKAIDPNSAKGKKIFADADAVMAYSPIEHGVFLNKNVLKNADTLAKYNRESEEAWNIVMNNIDTLSGSQKAMALRYKQAGRALVGDGSVGDYLQHEIGHHVQWEVLDAKTNNLIGSRMNEYALKVSGYATATKGEYIAESFSAYVKGQRNILDPEFVSFMDGKRLDNFGKSGIMNTNGIHAIGDKDAKLYIPYSFEPKVHKTVQAAFNSEYSKAVERFGTINTIRGVNVLNDNSSDEGLYNDNSGWISLRHAEKKNGLKTMLQIAQQKHKDGKWSTAEMHHVMRHEIGHAIQAEHEANDPEWALKKTKIFDVMQKAQANEEGFTLPSSYSANNIYEFMSECIAASYKKKPSKTVNRVVEIIIGGA